MKKYVFSGLVFGALLIPVSTLGLILPIVGILTYPLTFFPKIVVTGILDTQSVSGLLSVGTMAVVSVLFYGILGYLFFLTRTKWNARIASVLFITIYIFLLILIHGSYFNSSVSGSNPEPFVDQQEFSGRTGLECRAHSDCPTPISYAIQSNCPYQGVCIDNKCAVVCPMLESIPVETELTSEQITCESDSECDCVSWDSEEQYSCNCVNGGCVAVVEQ